MRDRRHSYSNIERLRLAIDCMPLATREAMLRGVQANPRIIVGAYVDGQGGVCPMLAAHRAGGRTNFPSFARAWDRFARAGRGPRTATERELSILVCQLQDSLRDVGAFDLKAAVAEHRELVGARRRALRRLVAEADPKGMIAARRARQTAARTAETFSRT